MSQPLVAVVAETIFHRSQIAQIFYGDELAENV